MCAVPNAVRGFVACLVMNQFEAIESSYVGSNFFRDDDGGIEHCFYILPFLW